MRSAKKLWPRKRTDFEEYAHMLEQAILIESVWAEVYTDKIDGGFRLFMLP